MKQKLYQTTEGKILFAGVLLSLALLIVIGYFAVMDMEIAKILVLTLIAHTFGGRAAGIGICIMNDFGPIVTIGYNFYLEVLIVCFTYSPRTAARSPSERPWRSPTRSRPMAGSAFSSLSWPPFS